MEFDTLIKAAMLSVAMTSLSAQAAITDVDLHSGTDADGNVLAAGSLDPFWTISTDGTQFAGARVAYPGAYPNYSAGQTCCGMETIDGTAAWISTPSVIATSPTTGWGTYNMVYARRSIDLTGYDLDTVSLSGRWRVADIARGIYVNGHLISGTDTNQYSFSADIGFSLAAGSGFFIEGLNTIELRGQSVNNVWDAFWVSTTVSGDVTQVPEARAWVMMLAGLGMLAAFRLHSAGRTR